MQTGVAEDWRVFAPRLTIEWLADAPDRRHRRLTGCLVSADLSGFTAMSERFATQGKRGAELLTEVVNSAFTGLIDAASRHGGDVLKFGGDALLIWFEGEDACVQACQACTRMQQVLQARFGRTGLRMSVGAHYGEYDVFLVGAPDWRELVLIGEPVTRTVDLEAAAEAGEVLISDELAAVIPGSWRRKRRDGQFRLRLDAVPLPQRPRPDLVGALANDAYLAAAEGLVAPTLREDVRALASIGGEHRMASVAFLELEGTDGTLRRFGPEALTERLDDLVQATQRISRQFGVQFLYTDVVPDGLKVISTAGAPNTTAKDEESALRYALEFVHGDPHGKLKCGVNRGRVFAGFLGSPTRRTYTVMGDPVNLAARLMTHARPGQVVATTELVAASRVEFRTTQLAPFLVKGKSRPIDAVVVEEATEQVRSTATERTEFVGREAELATLEGWVAQAVAGRGVAVEVIGSAGIGKSRLIDEAARDERLFVKVTVECQPYDVNTAYAAARAILRRVVGIPAQSDRRTAGQILERTVRRVRAELLALLPLIAIVADADVAPTPEVDAIADDFRVRRTHEAVDELLAAMLATPTMLLVEDAYYVDAASAALFGTVAERLRARPWVLIATRRPGTAPFYPETADRHVLELSALPADFATKLALRALSGPADRSRDVRAMIARAGGNPLFVLQLVDALQAGVAAEDLPESVERVVAERLDRLAPPDRTLLRHAAVLGPRFDTGVLAQILEESNHPLPDDRTWQRLADLVETDRGTQRRFLHVLYRDVAYEGLPFRRRISLHQRVGELLEASPGLADPALLSEHFSLAGDTQRTWKYSVAAGDQAWEALAVTEAAAAYRRALGVQQRLRGMDPIETARVAEALGDALERNADYGEADRRYQSAQRLIADSTHDDGPRSDVRLLRKRGVLRERAGKYRAALRWYDRARLVAADRANSSDAAELLVASAGVMHRLGRFQDLISLASRAVDEAGDDRATEAHACLLIQAGLTLTGRLEDTEYGERALALFGEVGNVLYEGKALNNLGIALYYTGDWVGAADYYRRAGERFEVAGDVVEAAAARNNQAEILSDQGEWDAAIVLLDEALQTWRRAVYPLGCALALSNLGRAHARAGRADQAVAALAEAMTALQTLGAEPFLIDARLRFAEARLLAGDAAGGAAAVDDLAATVDAGRGFPGSRATLGRLRCWQLRQAGRDDAAADAARAGIEAAVADGARYERALLLNELAELTGDPAVAAEHAAEAAALGVVALPALPLPI